MDDEGQQKAADDVLELTGGSPVPPVRQKTSKPISAMPGGLGLLGSAAILSRVADDAAAFGGGARSAQQPTAMAAASPSLTIGKALGSLAPFEAMGKISAPLGIASSKSLAAGLFGNISADLAAGWRKQLLSGLDAARLDVAGSISKVIAQTSLDALAGQVFVPGRATLPLGPALADGLRAYTTAIGANISEGLIAAIKPTALLASSSLIERLKASSAHQRLYDEALWELGWWMPPSVDMGTFWELGRLAHEGRRVELRREMVALAASSEFTHVLERWMELPAFRRRRHILRAGLADHRRRRYVASVPTLLPQIEGIAIEAFAPGSTARNPKGAIQTAVATYEMVMGPAMVDAVTVLWAHQSFDLVTPGTRRLNRQLVLHGRSTGYGVGENSARVLFALDLLASLVEDARKHPERAKAS